MYPKSIQFKKQVVPAKEGMSQATLDVLEYRLECLQKRVSVLSNLIVWLCFVVAMLIVFK